MESREQMREPGVEPMIVREERRGEEKERRRRGEGEENVSAN